MLIPKLTMGMQDRVTSDVIGSQKVEGTTCKTKAGCRTAVSRSVR
jgi:hypothetical protein